MHIHLLRRLRCARDCCAQRRSAEEMRAKSCAAAEEAKPSPEPASPVDYCTCSPAKLVQALQGDDREAQQAAVVAFAGIFEVDESEIDDDRVDALISCGAVPALLRLVQPDTTLRVDTCTVPALKVLLELPLYQHAPDQILSADGVARFWAVANGYFTAGGDSVAAALALENICRHLTEMPDGDWVQWESRHGGELISLLLRHADLASDVLRGIVACVSRVVITSRQSRTALVTEPVLKALTAILVRFKADDKTSGGLLILNTLALVVKLGPAPAYLDLRSFGTLAAAVQWLAAAAVDSDAYDDAASCAADFICAVYERAPLGSRPRLLDMLCMQPGALAGAARRFTWASPLVASLCAHSRLEVCLFDGHFMICHLATAFWKCEAGAVTELLESFDDECLVALATPLPHQQLAAAASAGVFSCVQRGARRLFASDKRIELVIEHFIAAEATGRAVNSCAPDFQKEALFASLTSAAVAAGLASTENCENVSPLCVPFEGSPAFTIGPPLKRARHAISTLTAADVNVKRRDSTVFVVAGQPFYAAGIILEKCSAVIADALRDAPAQASVELPMPADVPEASQYKLFWAAVEHAYTGDVTAALGLAALFELWCIADYLCMNELALLCCERLADALQGPEAGLFGTINVWKRALDRSATQLSDICAAAYLSKFSGPYTSHGVLGVLADTLAKLEADAPPGCKPSTHVARVLRAALLRTLAPADEAA